MTNSAYYDDDDYYFFASSSSISFARMASWVVSSARILPMLVVSLFRVICPLLIFLFPFDFLGAGSQFPVFLLRRDPFGHLAVFLPVSAVEGTEGTEGVEETEGVEGTEGVEEEVIEEKIDSSFGAGSDDSGTLFSDISISLESAVVDILGAVAAEEESAEVEVESTAEVEAALSWSAAVTAVGMVELAALLLLFSDSTVGTRNIIR